MDNTDNKKEGNSISKIILEVLIYLILIVFCAYITPNYIIQKTYVSGESMEDTLHDGENLIVNKFIYNFQKPQRYDIIIFYPKGRSVDEYYVKRIFGLPGETIQIKENDIYINGKKIDDPYAKDATSFAGIAEEPLKLKDDEYFVLGDHRSVSSDSRYSKEMNDGIGPVKFENIAGKAFLRVWPLDKFGLL